MKIKAPQQYTDVLVVLEFITVRHEINRIERPGNYEIF